MAFETEYSNTIKPVNVVVDAASANLLQSPVWKQHVLRVAIPASTQTVNIKKKGQLGRLALPENTEYIYGAYSEYLETSTLLNAMKSVVISKVTKEEERWSPSTLSDIGAEQGKALALGMEEDIATLAAGFSSSLVAAPTGATQLDLAACALNVQISTSGHAVSDSRIVAVLSPKTAFEIGVVQVLDPSVGDLPVFANPSSSSASGRDAFSAPGSQAGFMAKIGNIDVFVTNVIDSDGTNYRNLVFDPSRAIVGMWDDAAEASNQLEIEFFRNRYATCHFSDFGIHWDEAGCRLEAPVL